MPIYKYAGFWRRLVAFMIDNTIITIAFSALFIISIIAFLFGAMSGENSEWLADLINPTKFSAMAIFVWLLFLIITIVYFTYFHGATGRTPGKMLLGLEVLSVDGTPISFGIAFLRSVGYFVSSIFYLGFIWTAFDKRKQGWHDKIAGTIVIIREQESTTAGISIPDQPAVFPEPENYGGQAETFKGQSDQLDKISENNS